MQELDPVYMEKSFHGRGITHLLACVQTSPSPLKKSLSSIFAEGGGRLRTGYHLPGLPWAIQLSLHFLTKLGEPCFSMRSENLARLEGWFAQLLVIIVVMEGSPS